MSTTITLDAFQANGMLGNETATTTRQAAIRRATVHTPMTHSLDADQIREVRAELEALANLGEDVVLDLRHVEFIDSSGVGCIVFLLKRLQAQGLKLKLTHVTGQPRQLVGMLRLTFLIEEKVRK